MKRTPLISQTRIARTAPLPRSQWGKGKRKSHKTTKSKGQLQKQAVMKRAERVWSQIVRLKTDHVCEWCGRPAEEAHHVFGRDFPLRFEIRNGCALCKTCHDWAGRNPDSQKERFKEGRPDDYDYCEPLSHLNIPLKAHQIEEIHEGLKIVLRGLQ